MVQRVSGDEASSRAAKKALFDELARLGQALANGRRLEILDVLANGERTAVGGIRGGPSAARRLDPARRAAPPASRVAPGQRSGRVLPRSLLRVRRQSGPGPPPGRLSRKATRGWTT